jgi:triacylglycerol lipase
MTDMPQSRMDFLLDLLDQRPREDWEWRFEPHAAGLSPINALALANAALLAYSDSDAIHRFLDRWQLADVQVLSNNGSQAFVARQDDCVFVAFRGTEPLNLGNWLADFKYPQRRLGPDIAGLVHGGFARALDEILQPTLDAIAEVGRDRASRLYITGHSLGGALAVLAAAVLQFQAGRNVTAVYTYGQPRVGDQPFSSAYDAALGDVTFRFVNNLDIVPHVPPVRLPGPLGRNAANLAADELQTSENVPSGLQQMFGAIVTGQGFTHVGLLNLFLADGSLTDDELAWQEREVVYSGTLAEFLRNSSSLVRGGLSAFLRPHDRILDHDPVRGYLRRLEALLSSR